jgi:hypothetical protein
MLELGTRVIIKSKRACHKHLNGQIGEIFGIGEKKGRIFYGVSISTVDDDFYENELEEMREEK